MDKKVIRTCGHDGDLTYSSILDKYMCDDCWNAYGVPSHNSQKKHIL